MCTPARSDVQTVYHPSDGSSHEAPRIALGCHLLRSKLAKVRGVENNPDADRCRPHGNRSSTDNFPPECRADGDVMELFFSIA